MTERAESEETQELFIAELQSQLAQARREALQAKREALAAQHGIPAELIALLRAEDSEQLAQDAALLARAMRARGAQGVLGHAAEPAAPDLSWLRERLSGRANPFGRGGVRWQDE
ncbi:MAG: hypothetical protein CUN49_12020 [Candidatus Thermofonsia Clade 1 bacterium]|jgi:hypothetical protein|uniref:DUF4355 domain-containing protein n=1 Tax=Candidatus Thermofonsia Clade 1 bacterium TaxID=2364210 RepID=A0A2M8PC79_9CHLR|nr:MAG: hypothetical protein CUN49_12020 [Candidatus Thermofonsia Clade 1 bacterium]RMF48727.1 MAG: hypothetical protein D6749_14885 [Chloroflexota bacterium]